MLKNAFGSTIDSTDCGRSCPNSHPMCVNGTCLNPSCAHTKPYCNENTVAGVRARQFCPLTCGCHDPHAPLALALPASGCGRACIRYGGYLEKRRALPCEDVPTDNPAFQALINDYDKVRKDWPYDWNTSSAMWASDLRRFGCGFLNASNFTAYPPSLMGLNFCVEGGTWYPIKPLPYFCPVACGCRHGDPHCPDSCPARSASQPVCAGRL